MAVEGIVAHDYPVQSIAEFRTLSMLLDVAYTTFLFLFWHLE